MVINNITQVQVGNLYTEELRRKRLVMQFLKGMKYIIKIGINRIIDFQIYLFYLSGFIGQYIRSRISIKFLLLIFRNCLDVEELNLVLAPAARTMASQILFFIFYDLIKYFILLYISIIFSCIYFYKSFIFTNFFNLLP